MSIEVNGMRVYDAALLKTKIPSYFKGCSAVISKLIERKKIPADKYIYASYSKVHGYKVLDQHTAYRGKRLLLKADWVHEHVPGFIIPPVVVTPPSDEVRDVVEYPVLPPIANVSLNYPEELCVRGDRSEIGLFFKCMDVQKILHQADLRTMLTKSNGFIENTHYVYFKASSIVSTDSGNIRKTMYLTLLGMMRVLVIVPNQDVTTPLQQWVLSVLLNDKSDSTSNSKNTVNITTIKQFLDTNVNVLPVVYLFSVGRVKDLRVSLNISRDVPDDNIIMKYGLTKDLRRRTIEHDKTYGKMSADGISLVYHVYIDPFYLQYAETEIERYFKSAKWHLDNPKYTELIAVPEHMVSSIIHNEFKRLGATYAGKLSDLQTQLHTEQKVNEQLKKQMANQEEHHKELTEHMERSYRDVDRMYHTTLRDKDTIINMYKAADGARGINAIREPDTSLGLPI